MPPFLPLPLIAGYMHKSVYYFIELIFAAASAFDILLRHYAMRWMTRHYSLIATFGPADTRAGRTKSHVEPHFVRQ